jgi:transketolase
MPTAEKSPPAFNLHPRRTSYLRPEPSAVPELESWEALDAAYRALCAILYNFAPGSGHPGGSISSGRIVFSLLYQNLRYDFSRPDALDNDLLVYAAGHKAMGLYGTYALRDEWVRIARPDLLPAQKRRLRLEDLLGFRRNPIQSTPLFRKFGSVALDGHPTPLTPFVPVATGASGVGDASAVGLAIAAMDAFGPKGPRVHILEGEGGMTAGRVHEAIATAATAGLTNAIMHLDWNQASIDSDRVTAEGDQLGDYVQWDPRELLYVHGWNMIEAGDGSDFRRVHAAQAAALALDNGAPTAIVYRTTKGWNYGIEGKASHGAGHAFCSPEFYKSVEPFEKAFGTRLPRFEGEKTPERMEAAYWDCLLSMRAAFETKRPELARFAAERVAAAARATPKNRPIRDGGPDLEAFYKAQLDPKRTPDALKPVAGKATTLRGALGETLGHLNGLTRGAFLACAADLSESTSVAAINKGFAKGWYQAQRNPLSRLVPVGGICEDAMGGVVSGISSLGLHVGVSSSYSAFIAPLEHVPARLHCIGQQMRHEATGEPNRTMIMVNAHAGPMTGEDGPTHACASPLQILQDNFAPGASITLTPWDPAEMWPLMIAALNARPALLAPFVTRPAVPVPDREKLGFPPAHAAVNGVYALRRGGKAAVVLQGHGVATFFTRDVLPKLDAAGIKLNVFYVTSAELFERLSPEEKRAAFPPDTAFVSMGITDFTLPTLWRWVRSDAGIAASLYPYKRHGYLGSGAWDKVLEQAGLDGKGQLEAVEAWVKSVESRS